MQMEKNCKIFISKKTFQIYPFLCVLVTSWFRETKSSLTANDHHGKKASKDLVLQIYEKNTH